MKKSFPDQVYFDLMTEVVQFAYDVNKIPGFGSSPDVDEVTLQKELADRRLTLSSNWVERQNESLNIFVRTSMKEGIGSHKPGDVQVWWGSCSRGHMLGTIEWIDGTVRKHKVDDILRSLVDLRKEIVLDELREAAGLAAHAGIPWDDIRSVIDDGIVASVIGA